jgi:hypothetical protein
MRDSVGSQKQVRVSMIDIYQRKDITRAAAKSLIIIRY